jgi:putative transcriptional regulator
MSKGGEKLLAGMRDLIAYLDGDTSRGRVTKVKAKRRLDVRAVRRGTRLTQAAFAGWLGVDVTTLRAWERGTSTPDGPARRLLWVVASDPEIVRLGAAAE